MKGNRKFIITLGILLVVLILGLTKVMDGGNITTVLSVLIPSVMAANAFIHSKGKE